MSSRVNLHDNINNTTLELQQDLARSTPRQCVTLTHSVPSVQMYYALKTKLENCTLIWLQEFLDLDGLDSLLNSLDQMSGRGFTCFSDAILQIDCISCIRCILNTSLGLEFFINSDVYTKKLTLAMNCSDTLPKKQVFEMLSAICVYSNIGYLRVMEGLSYVKSECDQLHRFSLVVNDIQKSEALSHKTAIMTFINAIINSTPDVTERIRIRNEFIGLNLLDVMTYIRKTEPDEDILLQLEVFHERKLADEESVNTNNNIDYNSPHDLLDHIQAKVFGTHKMVNFVNVLQDLLAIETSYGENSCKLWQTVDSLIHHVIHTMDTRSLDNLQSELQRLPEQLSLGLQCIYSYQNTVQETTVKHTTQTCWSKTVNNCTSKSSLKVVNESKDMTCRLHGNQNFSLKSHSEQEKNISGNSLQDSKTSTPSSSMNSNGSCNSGIQDTTVVTRQQMAEDCKMGDDRRTSLYDNTIVANPKPISPSELTYFSNMANNSGDGHSRTSSSGNESNSPQCNTSTGALSSSNHSNNFHSTPVQSNKHFNISGECSMNGINYNLTNDKNYKYSQNKVGGKLYVEVLGTRYSSGKESKGTGLDSCEDKEMCQSKTKNNSNNIGTNIPNGNYKKAGYIKHSNRIDRQPVPSPTKQLNEFRWITLADDKIVGREPCVWLPSLADDKLLVDFMKLESVFTVISPCKSQAVEEIVLLNANSRLRINLFLSRLDSGAEDLVQNLQEGNTAQLTLPMLQYLNKIVPCVEEIMMLRAYSGPRLELGMAEQFVLLLSDIPDYSVLLEGHLVRAEFDANTRQFKTSLNAMIDMGNLVLKNPDLKRVLHLILHIGNFLNHGTFNGDVAGFKICSLLRLQEVKCVSPCKDLLNYIVTMATGEDKKILAFVKELLPLEKAASCSMEDMKADISKLNGKLRFFMNNLSHSSSKLQAMFQPFIETLKKEFECIQCATTELRSLTDQIAEYFCEDVARFNLQECFKCIITFCKQISKCQSELLCASRQQPQLKKKGDGLQKKLKSKLLSLEFGQNAGASSSMMEEKTKVVERLLDQLHRGNFNPCVKSELPTPDQETAHPLEMSCIPFEGSPPQLRQRLGTNMSDNVFIETPELVCASYGSGNEPKLTRSSTQKLRPVTTTCTAQTAVQNNLPKSDMNKQSGLPLIKDGYIPSPIRAESVHDGKKVQSGTLQRKLFPMAAFDVKKDIYVDKKLETDGMVTDGKTRRQLQLPSRKGTGTHRRSRSDLADSVCFVNKWIEYEKMCTLDMKDGIKAPIAEPESACNLSILNLENQGKFITNKDIAALYSQGDANNRQNEVRNIENGPIVKLPDNKNRKLEKKSSTGFWSKLGRAVLKQRNVYSEGDEYVKPTKEPRKKSFTLDKENVRMEQMPANEVVVTAENRRSFKSEANSNKVSRFFQRGGLYRSSKMKKKNQNVE